MLSPRTTVVMSAALSNSTSTGDLPIEAIAGGSAGGVLLVLVALCACIVLRRRRSRRESSANAGDTR